MKEYIYLAQSDTTAGFLSINPHKINELKNRDKQKPILLEISSLDELKNISRIPPKFRYFIRRSKKMTFILPNKKSFRLINEEFHLKFLKKFGKLYSSSANKTTKKFDYLQALEMCNILILDKRGIFEGKASKIFQINQNKIKKIR